jgi:cation:H+ antiporter
MALSVLLLVVGLVLLVRASDVLVSSAARLSVALRLSPTVIGVVIIGFGTSTPELLVSALAAVEGLFDLGVGNIVGSNVANVLLVLGVAAVVGPVAAERSTVRREVPLSLGAVLLFAWAVQGPLRVVDALLLLAFLGVALTVLIMLSRREGAATPEEVAEVDATQVAVGRESIRALLGLTFTLAGAQMVVLGGGAIAEGLGLNEGLIGLTLVAVGTSLPELAASVQAVRRGESELLVGNILGSNLFNAAAVGAVVVWTGAGLGRTVTPALAGTATLVMVVSAVAVSLLLAARRQVGRTSGFVLLVSYVVAVLLVAR